MALDGIFLSLIKKEIEKDAVGMRVEKVHQPSREEMVLVLRGKNGAKKLFLSSRANSPRIHFTLNAPENPKTPTMLCMLLRKKLTGSLVTGIRQHENDRILFIDFDATNEIGDRIKLILCIEIMAQYSNIILMDGEQKIIDSLKRVDISTSSVRQILPGLQYKLPPAQHKLCLRQESPDKILERILSFQNKDLSSAILSSIEGISPIVSREIAFMTSEQDDRISELTDEKKSVLLSVLEKLKNDLENENVGAYLVSDENGKPVDFSFLKINQYGKIRTSSECSSFSELLDVFYCERDRILRTKQRSDDLFKMLGNTLQRISKKINLQKSELEQCADRETLRINAELISANQYCLEKGKSFYEVENYYDKNKIIRIPADPALSPSANSQKYYKEYRKAKTAELMLTKLIEKGEIELEYIESVIDELNRSDSEDELREIRSELIENGYCKAKSKSPKKVMSKSLPVREYYTDDGFKVLVGRNNIQNDKLSLKTAKNNDMFLHTQKIHGSHVIISSDNREISDLAIEQAAVLAAYHSKARESSQVPIDYTLAKNLKKPNGAKPGMVIYHVYNTIIVHPDANLVSKLENNKKNSNN